MQLLGYSFANASHTALNPRQGAPKLVGGAPSVPSCSRVSSLQVKDVVKMPNGKFYSCTLSDGTQTMKGRLVASVSGVSCYSRCSHDHHYIACLQQFKT